MAFYLLDYLMNRKEYRIKFLKKVATEYYNIGIKSKDYETKDQCLCFLDKINTLLLRETKND